MSVQTGTTYQIHGLHCPGCIAALEERMAEGVTIQVAPSLETVEVTFHKQSRSLEELQAMFGEYSIAPLEETRISVPINSVPPPSPKKNTLATFYPLLLILSYMVGSVTVYSVRHDEDVMRGMELIMGLFYLIFSFFKLLQLPGFVRQFRKYDLISFYIPQYAYLYPIIEVGLGSVYMWGGQPQILYVNVITLVLFVMNLACVRYALQAGKQLECACLGAILSLPLSTVTVIEDSIMIVMSIIGIIIH